MKLSAVTNRGSRRDFVDLFDAEAEPLPRMLAPFEWSLCKQFFIREVRALVLP